ncbi:MAG: DUF3667 domain-containing protein [bacterium]
MFGGGAADLARAHPGERHDVPSDDVRPAAHAPPDDRCPNCGEGPIDKYCAKCGQRVLSEHDLTIAGFAHDTVHEFTSLDGRLWPTMVALLTRPGLLAREYFDGRGTRYMKPLSLFVLLNLVFFLIQPHTGLLRYDLEEYIGDSGGVASKLQDAANAKRIDGAMRVEAQRRATGQPPRAFTPESMELFRARFDSTLQDLKKSMLIVSIPILAFGMFVLYIGTGRRYAEHLVFSVHVYAYFLFISGVVLTPLFIGVFMALRAFGQAGRVTVFLLSEPALIGFLFAVMASYIYLGLRRMYGGSRLAAGVRAVFLFGLMQLLIVAYHDVLFYATLASL